MTERETNEIQQEATKDRPGFMIYFEEALIWDKYLNAEEMSALFRAILHYAKSGTEPEKMPLHVKIFYDQMRGKIKRDQQKYDRTCEKRRQAAIIREAKKKVRESQNDTRENTVNTRKNEIKDSTSVTDMQISDDGADLSQQALTVTRNHVTRNHVTPNAYPQTISSSVDEIKKYWELIWGKTATEREIEAFYKMVNERYELEDIRDALRKAHQNADDNPAGYMLTILKDWKEHGKPKRPYESRELMQRHSDEDRRQSWAAAVVDLDSEE